MRTNTRRKILVAVQILVSAGLLIYLLGQVDLAKLLSTWGGLRQPFLWLALALQLGGVLISSLKWWLLLRAAGQPVPYGWTVRTYLVGQFFSNFLPTQIGGDAVRMYALSRRIGRPAIAIASVFVERITGFLALTAIASVALAASAGRFAGARQVLLAVVGCILVAAAGLVVAFLAPWIVRRLARLNLPDALGWRGKLRSFADSLAIYYAYPRTLALVIALAFGYQLSWILVNYAVAQALALEIPLAFVALMVPVSDIVGLVPIFFNSLGAREGTYVLLLGLLGLPAESALAISFVIFGVRLVVSALGGVLYALGGVGQLRGAVEDEAQSVQGVGGAEK
ncbi:MAG TPA: lysylphosphatidylglycerol synthase transmembrane domain-containing protein [Roseiflexaceae bacterium]